MVDVIISVCTICRSSYSYRLHNCAQQKAIVMHDFYTLVYAYMRCNHIQSLSVHLT
jgi:hypothetical protein